MKTVLVLGATGMLGHMLARELSKSFRTYATVRLGKADVLRRNAWFDNCEIIEDVEAGQKESYLGAINHARADVVVNAIGLVKQRSEAKDPARCILVNSLFPHLLSQMCQSTGTRLIHISTDCVFSGKKGAYSEEDDPDPVDLYDHTKLLGEVSREGTLTLRTSFIGRELQRTTGLVEWFLSKRDQTVSGFRGAIFSGLSTQSMATVLRELILDYPSLDGIHHVSSDSISKYELLVRLNDLASLNIEVIPEDEPFVDRSLDSQSFWRMVELERPTWDQMLHEIAINIPEYEMIRAYEEPSIEMIRSVT